MSPQSTIAHYRIIAKIGEGGMGTVYRATDTKLNRDVAIKVLPDAVAQDPNRMARFAREAHLLAALNHPNIAAIYGIEQNAIVMELVEGEDLKGPVPGHELFYETSVRGITRVEYAAKGDSFAAGQSRPWPVGQISDAGPNSAFDVAPDGKHLAAILPAGSGSGEKPLTELTVLLNFFDEVKRRVK